MIESIESAKVFSNLIDSIDFRLIRLIENQSFDYFRLNSIDSAIEIFDWLPLVKCVLYVTFRGKTMTQRLNAYHKRFKRLKKIDIPFKAFILKKRLNV